jgi:hypothetical protein
VGLPKSAYEFQQIKSMGFSDKKLAQLVSKKVRRYSPN